MLIAALQGVVRRRHESYRRGNADAQESTAYVFMTVLVTNYECLAKRLSYGLIVLHNNINCPISDSLWSVLFWLSQQIMLLANWCEIRLSCFRYRLAIVLICLFIWRRHILSSGWRKADNVEDDVVDYQMFAKK